MPTIYRIQWLVIVYGLVNLLCWKDAYGFGSQLLPRGGDWEVSVLRWCAHQMRQIPCSWDEKCNKDREKIREDHFWIEEFGEFSKSAFWIVRLSTLFPWTWQDGGSILRRTKFVLESSHGVFRRLITGSFGQKIQVLWSGNPGERNRKCKIVWDFFALFSAKLHNESTP